MTVLDNDKDFVRDIITDVEKLSTRCDEVDVVKDNAFVRETVVELKETLRKYEKGLGLAAPQIGKNVRIFVINFNGELRAFINPIITQTKSISFSREGCLSIPNKEYILPRFGEIEVMYQTPLGKTMTQKFIGLAAFVYQHELDHLDGVLMSDIGLEMTPEFDNATEEERDEVLRMYLESLDLKTKSVTKNVEEDPELKKINDSIEFMTKVQKGEIQIEQREFTEEEKAQMKEKLKDLQEKSTSESKED